MLTEQDIYRLQALYELDRQGSLPALLAEAKKARKFVEELTA